MRKRFLALLFICGMLVCAIATTGNNATAAMADDEVFTTEISEDGALIRTYRGDDRTTTAPDMPEYAPDEIVFKLTDTAHQRGVGPLKAQQIMHQRVREVAKRHRFTRTTAVFRNHRKENLRRIQQAHLPPGVSVAQAIRQLKADPAIEWAEPKYIVSVFLPNDTYIDPNNAGGWTTGAWGQSFTDLWGMEKIQAEQAWQAGHQGEGVIVAVIDTGVDYNHEDIAANMWINSGETPGDGIDNDGNGYIDDIYGYDFATYGGGTQDSDPSDGHGHGTHCAGTIAAVINNGLGVAGVAPQAKIMALKGLSDSARGYNTDLADAVVYAADNGADVLSNSWGGPGVSQVLQDAFRYAHELGCVCVAAAGNDNTDMANHYPSHIDAVIAVAATDVNDEKADFSNYGTLIDVAAPGVDILSLRARETGDEQYFVPPGDQSARYCRMSGTSMACPHVAGLAAIIRAIHPEFSNEQIRQAIKVSADDLGDMGFDVFFGSGRINAAAAIDVNTVCEAWINPVGNTNDILVPTDITGIAAGADFQSYKLEYGSIEDGIMHTIISSTTEVSNGMLATSWYPEYIAGGSYDLLLTVMDSNGIEYSYVRRISVPNLNMVSPSNNQLFSGKSPVFVEGTAYHPSPGFAYDVSYKPWSTNIWTDQMVTLANDGNTPVIDGLLATIDPQAFNESGKYDVRITIYYDEKSSPCRTPIHVDTDVIYGFPTSFVTSGFWMREEVPTLADIDGDGDADIAFSHLDTIYAYDGQGGSLPGWPYDVNNGVVEQGISMYPDPNNPGKMGLITGTTSGYLYNLDYTGWLKQGFPLYTMTYRNAIGDLNRDGEDDLVSADVKLIVSNLQGNNLSGWPQYPGETYGTPAIGDIDGDGSRDIAIVHQQGDSNTAISVYNSAGNLLPGWPVEHNESPDWRGAQIVLGDIDKDGKRELVVGVGGSGSIHVLRYDGSTQPGWPQPVDGNVGAYPTLGDVDSDGYLEVIVVGVNGTLHMWNYMGNPVSGWPIQIAGGTYSSPATVGNIDSDPEPEIILGAGTFLRAFNPDGSAVDGFPKQVGQLSSNSCPPALGDIDNDGLTEIVYIFGPRKKILAAWDTNSVYLPGQMQWPMIDHDPGHTCSYGPGRSGFITLDRTAYSCDDIVRIRVGDAHLEGQPIQNVTLVTDGGDFETVTLAENPPNSGFFEAQIPVSSNSVNTEDGSLQVSHGETITAAYEDANSLMGSPAQVQALAKVDCADPVIFNVDISVIRDVSAVVTLDTDEFACARVRYALSCNDPNEATLWNCDEASPSIQLFGLDPNTTYFFVVDVRDIAGNTATFDNSGNCYTFTTVPLPIVDPNLKAAIEQELNLIDLKIVDLLGLNSLHAGNKSIASLTGLEWATNLTSLYLNDNQISDISALSGLTNLMYLYLSNNDISDISAVSGLTNLTSLHLSSNMISDVNDVSGLTNLTSLHLSSNMISDVNDVSDLMNLTILDLSNNQISDISAGSGLTNLTTLSLNNNQISDISAVSGLTNLTSLSLLGNPLNTPAYCTYLPSILENNPGISLFYDEPNPNPLTVDCSTDLVELAVFAAHWLEINCDVPNNWCGWADLDHIDDVGFKDLAEFVQYWLE